MDTNPATLSDDNQDGIKIASRTDRPPTLKHVDVAYRCVRQNVAEKRSIL